MALQSPSKVSEFNHLFIHSLMSENDRNVSLIVCDFHKEGHTQFHI